MRCISQAIALASLVGDELVHAWRSVTENIEPDKITHKSIRNLLFPPSESDLPTTRTQSVPVVRRRRSALTRCIKVPPTLHESIHKEAAERGISIVELIKTMFEFFISGRNSVNSHLFGAGDNSRNYAKRERIWREDLAKLIAENEATG